MNIMKAQPMHAPLMLEACPIRISKCPDLTD